MNVVMFSSGAGSAMAAKRVADRDGTEDLVLLFADVNGEHGDNYRFLREAAAWVGGALVVLDNGGKTIWAVFAEVKFLGNTRIDPCSRVLKREPMRKWLEENCDPGDTTVHLGFDWTEEHRLVRARGYWDPWTIDCPLMWDPILDKAEGMAAMAAAGLEPPLLTRQGFPHANCGGGCVKAGIKQFRKLLEVNPSEYAKWEWNEQQLRTRLGKNVAILRDRTGGKVRPLTLRELRGEDHHPAGAGLRRRGLGVLQLLHPLRGGHGMNHTDECERARAGHLRYWRDQWGDKHVTDEPDPYPTMADLSAEMQQAVLACPHKDHDVVRLFWGVGA